jgi:putative transposase
MNPRSIYRFIAAEKASFLRPGDVPCAWHQPVGVLLVGRPRWCSQRPRAARRAAPAASACRVGGARRVYGARRLTAEVRDRGMVINRKAVARLMRHVGMEGAHRRLRGKPRRLARSNATAPDLVERQFAVEGPDRLWVADISYLRTWEGFLYLAVVIDA